MVRKIPYFVNGAGSPFLDFVNVYDKGRYIIHYEAAMTEIVPVAIIPPDSRRLTRIGLGAASTLPALFTPSEMAAKRFWEFFTVTIRNRNTRRAYFDAVSRFAAWCEHKGLRSLAAVQPVHVAGYIEELTETHAKPTVKQHLAPSACSRLARHRPGDADQSGACRARPEA